MDLKTIFAVIGVLATMGTLGAVGVYVFMRYEERQWIKKQVQINEACGRTPSNDN